MKKKIRNGEKEGGRTQKEKKNSGRKNSAATVWKRYQRVSNLSRGKRVVSKHVGLGFTSHI